MTTFEIVWRRLTSRGPFTDLLALTLLTWAGFLVTMLGLAIGIGIFGTVTGSVWEPSSQIARGWAAFIGGYVCHDVLALYVTHGQTRREFAQTAAVYVVAFAAVVGVLLTIGYLFERVLYRIADWPHSLADEHLYSSTLQVPAIFVEYWLLMLVWTAAGALVGGAFYRSSESGLVAIALAAVPVTVTDIALGGSWGPLYRLVELLGNPSPPSALVAIALALASFAVTLAMAWPVIRDIPIRSKSA